MAALLPKAIKRAESYFLDVWRNQVPQAARPFIRDIAGGKVIDPVDGTGR